MNPLSSSTDKILPGDNGTKIGRIASVACAEFAYIPKEDGFEPSISESPFESIPPPLPVEVAMKNPAWLVFPVEALSVQAPKPEPSLSPFCQPS